MAMKHGYVVPKKYRVEVDKAMRIIGPTARRKDVEEAVVFGRDLVERQKQVKNFHGKRQKVAAESLSAKIHNLKSALADPCLASSIRQDFPIDGVTLDEWRDRARQAADISGLDPPGLGPRRVAVMLAADLLEKYRLPITTTRKPNKSQFLRLSAVFSGHPEANLYRQCCEFKRSAFGTELYLIYGLNTEGPLSK